MDDPVPFPSSHVEWAGERGAHLVRASPMEQLEIPDMNGVHQVYTQPPMTSRFFFKIKALSQPRHRAAWRYGFRGLTPLTGHTALASGRVDLLHFIVILRMARA
jgi:hypothetical protein